MRIPEFNIVNRRNIRLANCDDVPRVMIITGPNGCGKSTLLDGLRNASGPNGPILYVGPHRTSGRQTVQMRDLYQNKVSMRQLQSSTNLPNVDGVRIHSQTRSAWDFDETSNYLKYALCQVELDRQSAITSRLDKYGEIEKGDIPDIWEPLKEMTENLLPHLHFFKIDISNRNRVKCLWKVHTKNIEVDIDDLSSGEKAIVQLFFPLIENRIQDRLAHCTGVEQGLTVSHKDESVCVLMDEPELHLHPNLQNKILDYIRGISIKEQIQFIIASHSPTIVEQASSDELYLLRPSELVAESQNQLVRIATDDEKLNLMREAFGSTSNITAMRNILIVEGRTADAFSKSASDERVLSFLSERFAKLTIFSGGNKAACIKLARTLSHLIVEELTDHLRAFALVDVDLDSTDSLDKNIHTLPVSMIENFLVDPFVLWNAMSVVSHKTPFSSVSEVNNTLNIILDELHEFEVQRRVKAEVGFFNFRLKDPIERAQEQLAEHVEEVSQSLSQDRIACLRVNAEREINALHEQHKRRECFDGKKILAEFYSRHMHSTGMSKEIFIYECAKYAAERQTVKRFVSELFEKIEGS